MSTQVYSLGIQMDLTALNLKLHGLALPIDKNQYALFHACGTTDCPQDMVCDQNQFGIWVFEAPNNCTAFRDVCSEFGLLYEDSDKGLTAQYAGALSTSSFAKVSIVCDFDLEMDCAFGTDIAITQWHRLSLVAHTENACTRIIFSGFVRWMHSQSHRYME
jgi:hypothetical protein